MIENIYRYKTTVCTHKIYAIFTNTHAENKQKLQYTKTNIKVSEQHYNTYKNLPTKKLHNIQKSPL